MYSNWYETSVQGYVRQASGKSIAFGSVDAQFDGDQARDGSPHVLVLDVAADPAGVPFKSGTAVVAASGYADWTSQNWETGESGRNRGYAVDRLGGHEARQVTLGRRQLRHRTGPPGRPPDGPNRSGQRQARMDRGGG